MDPQAIYTTSGTPDRPYTNCQTQVINLSQFEIPEKATEQQYRSIYASLSAQKSPQSKQLNDAVNSIVYGISPPVAFPTETVYGLGADATNRASIAGIFAAKGRPSDNPLIVHVASREHLERLIGKPLPEIYTKLVEEYWPGPLTLLIPVPEDSVFAHNVHPGQMTIGFRVPASKYARFFIAAADRPLAAPSANSSGKPSPTTAEHVMEDMQGKINFILDGGICDVGVESTVVDGLCDPPLILRPGGVSQDGLIRHGKRHGNAWARTAIGYKQAHDDHEDGSQSTVSTNIQAPRAPGMKYKHYAPHGKLILLDNHKTYGRLHSEIDHIIDSTLITSESSLKAAIHKTSNPAEQENDFKIAILTTTTWSPFADLPLDTNPLRLPSATGAQPPHFETLVAGMTTDSTTTAHDHRLMGSSSNNDNTQIQKSTYRNHTIISINLGRTPKQIAQTLFAALRTCDSLNCTYIFAEMPANPNASVNANANNSHHETTNPSVNNTEHSRYADNDSSGGGDGGDVGDGHYDAVIERMRKAASQIIISPSL